MCDGSPSGKWARIEVKGEERAPIGEVKEFRESSGLGGRGETARPGGGGGKNRRLLGKTA